MTGEVWVYSDFSSPHDYKLMYTAHLLSRNLGSQAAAICACDTDMDKIAQSGADIIYHLNEDGSYILKARDLARLCEKYKPDIVLFPSQAKFGGIAAQTAVLVDTGLTADCIGLAIDANKRLCQTRYAYGGGVIADIYCSSNPQMATVRQKGLPEPKWNSARKAEHIFIRNPVQADTVKVLSREYIEHKNDLNGADIIVAGGKGMGGRDGFRVLQKFADKIGGSLGASRSAVDAGYADYRCQIGQTGRTVGPRLYIAVGISGAHQHVAGMYTSGKVIAINCDPKAPIFDYADLALVGDWKEIIPALMADFNNYYKGRKAK